MIEVTFSLSTGELKDVRDLGSSPKDDEAFDDFSTLLAKKGVAYLKSQGGDCEVASDV